MSERAVEDLSHEVVDEPTAEREQLLRNADPEIAREVRALIDAHHAAARVRRRIHRKT